MTYIPIKPNMDIYMQTKGAAAKSCFNYIFQYIQFSCHFKNSKSHHLAREYKKYS